MPLAANYEEKTDQVVFGGLSSPSYEQRRDWLGDHIRSIKIVYMLGCVLRASPWRYGPHSCYTCSPPILALFCLTSQRHYFVFCSET